jgi:hypothetical protein
MTWRVRACPPARSSPAPARRGLSGAPRAGRRGTAGRKMANNRSIRHSDRTAADRRTPIPPSAGPRLRIARIGHPDPACTMHRKDAAPLLKALSVSLYGRVGRDAARGAPLARRQGFGGTKRAEQPRHGA